MMWDFHWFKIFRISSVLTIMCLFLYLLLSMHFFTYSFSSKPSCKTSNVISLYNFHEHYLELLLLPYCIKLSDKSCIFRTKRKVLKIAENKAIIKIVTFYLYNNRLLTSWFYNITKFINIHFSNNTYIYII